MIQGFTCNKDYINKIRSILDTYIGQVVTKETMLSLEHDINEIIADWNLNFDKVNTDPRNIAPYRCEVTYNKLLNSLDLELLDEFGKLIPNIKY